MNEIKNIQDKAEQLINRYWDPNSAETIDAIKAVKAKVKPGTKKGALASDAPAVIAALEKDLTAYDALGPEIESYFKYLDQLQQTIIECRRKINENIFATQPHGGGHNQALKIVEDIVGYIVPEQDAEEAKADFKAFIKKGKK